MYVCIYLQRLENQLTEVIDLQQREVGGPDTDEFNCSYATCIGLWVAATTCTNTDTHNGETTRLWWHHWRISVESKH